MSPNILFSKVIIIGKEINFRIFLFLSIKGKISENLFPLI